MLSVHYVKRCDCSKVFRTQHIDILTPHEAFYLHAAAHGLESKFRVGIPRIQRFSGDFN
jgi:hypothetical protein